MIPVEYGFFGLIGLMIIGLIVFCLIDNKINKKQEEAER